MAVHPALRLSALPAGSPPAGSTKYINTNHASYATAGYTLGGDYATIAIGPLGTIGGPGLLADGGASYTILNQGTISGTNTGVDLQNGGFVFNEDGVGVTTGATYGVKIVGGAGTVWNNDFVEATGTTGAGVYLGQGGLVDNIGLNAQIKGTTGVVIHGTTGTLENSGIIGGTGTGAALYAAGSVVNAASAGIIGNVTGLYVDHAGVIVTNFGTIGSSATANAVAIDFKLAGDTLVDEAGSVFVGAVYGGGGTLRLTGTGAPFGSLAGFSNFATIDVAAGVKWEFDSASNVAVDAESVLNQGTIEATGPDGVGVILGNGVFNNAAGGNIVGVSSGIYTKTCSVVNSGTVSCSDGAAVYVKFHAVVINNTNAVLDSGLSGARFYGPNYHEYSGTSFLDNSGTIEGKINGIFGAFRVVASNSSVGLVTGGNFGVYVDTGGTLLNSGRITSADGCAVHLGTGNVDNNSDALVNNATGLITGYDGVFLDTA